MIKSSRISRLIETYPGTLQTSKMVSFAAIINGFHHLTIVSKLSVLYISEESLLLL